MISKDKQKITSIFHMVLMKRLLMRQLTETSAMLSDIREMLEHPEISNIATPRSEGSVSRVT